MTARGIKNNNPGNIRHGAQWIGLSESQTDAAFCQFIAPEYGIRALCVLLRNYRRLYGLDSVREIINRYAPSAENNTEAYVSSVASAIGCGADEALDLSCVSVMKGLVRAIIKHENGECPYDDHIILNGIEKAANG